MDKKIQKELLSTKMCMKLKKLWINKKWVWREKKDNYNKSLTSNTLSIYNNQVCMNKKYNTLTNIGGAIYNETHIPTKEAQAL